MRHKRNTNLLPQPAMRKLQIVSGKSAHRECVIDDLQPMVGTKHACIERKSSPVPPYTMPCRDSRQCQPPSHRNWCRLNANYRFLVKAMAVVTKIQMMTTRNTQSLELHEQGQRGSKVAHTRSVACTGFTVLIHGDHNTVLWPKAKWVMEFVLSASLQPSPKIVWEKIEVITVSSSGLGGYNSRTRSCKERVCNGEHWQL